MREEGGFTAVIEAIRAGDEAAAAELHGRFARRLVVLACRMLAPWARQRADRGPEDLVQSVFRTFFLRCRRGEFDLSEWDDAWRLLIVITRRKCSARHAYLRATRRGSGRALATSPDRLAGTPDREPTPEEALTLIETLRAWLGGLSPIERRVAELGLQGYADPEIAEMIERSERTVRRATLQAERQLVALLRSTDDPAVNAEAGPCPTRA